jgi:hypothetical protein
MAIIHVTTITGTEESRKMKRIIYTGIFVIILIFAVTSSFAKLTITPSLTVKEEYNDNILLTNSDREDDFITTVYPNITIKYSPNKSLDLDLDYGLNFKFYSQHSELNNTSIRETQEMKLKAQIRPLSRIFIDIFDLYRRVPIDLRRKIALENEVVNKTESNTFSVSPYMILSLTSTVSTTVGYGYENIWYKDEEAIDSQSHSAFLTLSKKFSSRMNGTMKYNYLAYRPDLQNKQNTADEYDRHDGSLAVAYRILPTLEIRGEIGEARFDFREDKDTKSTFWKIETDYSFEAIEATSIEASYSTFFYNSTTSGIFKRRKIDVYFKTGKTFKLIINPYYSTDRYFDSDREDRVIGGTFNISRPLSKKIAFSLNGELERQKFSPEDERVERYSLGTNLDYRVSRSIITSLGYRYNNRNSDIDTDDFHNNIVWLQAKITF